MSGTIFLATGGTGGHVFPARALAAELVDRGYQIIVVTDRRGHDYERLFDDAKIHRIDAASPSGVNLMGKLSTALMIARGIKQARRLIAKEAPVAVVGFGGYPSLPTMFAAMSYRKPTILHEQNSVLGRVNKLLATRVRGLALSFPDTAGVESAKIGDLRVTGNPVRSEIIEVGRRPYLPPGADDPLRLLIFGGSQGAHILSRVLPEAIAMIRDDMPRKVRVVQQCRPEDIDNVVKIYQQSNIDATVREFFDDMPTQLQKSHVVIARAGASTIFEIAAAGRPSILVPYAAAMDDHQTNNAQALSAVGGAQMISEADFTVRKLATVIRDMAVLPTDLSELAAAAKNFAPDNSAAQLADFILAHCAHNSENQGIAA